LERDVGAFALYPLLSVSNTQSVFKTKPSELSLLYIYKTILKSRKILKNTKNTSITNKKITTQQVCNPLGSRSRN
tara:strand:+ start:129 stop:353 length:225 start_codon:yes stop_codon:yes gene_type:complete